MNGDSIVQGFPLPISNWNVTTVKRGGNLVTIPILTVDKEKFDSRWKFVEIYGTGNIYTDRVFYIYDVVGRGNTVDVYLDTYWDSYPMFNGIARFY